MTEQMTVQTTRPSVNNHSISALNHCRKSASSFNTNLHFPPDTFPSNVSPWMVPSRTFPLQLFVIPRRFPLPILLHENRAKSVASSLVCSRLNYANSLLFSTTQKNINRLQHVQNTLGRVVASHALPRGTRSSDIL